MIKRMLVLVFAMLFCVASASAMDSAKDRIDSLDSKALHDYELYGERNVAPDEHEEENAQRLARKLVELKEFKEKLNERNKLKKATDIDAKSGDSIYYHTHVPLHQQIETYYCGPATGLQTIDNWGRADRVPADPTQQDTLAEEMDTTTDGTSIYKVRDVVNDYLPYEYYVASKIKDTSSSEEDLKDESILNFDNDHAVVYLVIKNRLDYYEGTGASGHYISGCGYEDYEDEDSPNQEDQIYLVDCHYLDKYAGSHREDFYNVFEALYDYYESRGVANFLW